MVLCYYVIELSVAQCFFFVNKSVSKKTKNSWGRLYIPNEANDIAGIERTESRPKLEVDEEL